MRSWHYLLACCWLFVFALNVPAQEKSWVGKTILTKRDDIPVTGDDGQGKKVIVGTLDHFEYKVVDDKGGSIKVRTPQGKEGWFDKSGAVLMENATGYFTELINKNSNDARAYGCRGLAWRFKGDLALAHKDLDEAVRLNPKNIRLVEQSRHHLACEEGICQGHCGF